MLIRIYFRNKINILCKLNIFQFGFNSREKDRFQNKNKVVNELDLEGELGFQVRLVSIYDFLLNNIDDLSSSMIFPLSTLNK